MFNGNMIAFYVLLPLLLLPIIVTADIAPKGMKEFNKRCPATKLCPDLEKYYQQCKKQPDTAVCREFIETMKELSPVYDCQRDFDRTNEVNYIVPAIWICNEKERREEKMATHIWNHITTFYLNLSLAKQ